MCGCRDLGYEGKGVKPPKPLNVSSVDGLEIGPEQLVEHEVHLACSTASAAH